MVWNIEKMILKVSKREYQINGIDNLTSVENFNFIQESKVRWLES